MFLIINWLKIKHKKHSKKLYLYFYEVVLTLCTLLDTLKMSVKYAVLI